jgi:hypothetical protein
VYFEGFGNLLCNHQEKFIVPVNQPCFPVGIAVVSSIPASDFELKASYELNVVVFDFVALSLG